MSRLVMRKLLPVLQSSGSRACAFEIVRVLPVTFMAWIYIIRTSCQQASIPRSDGVKVRPSHRSVESSDRDRSLGKAEDRREGAAEPATRPRDHETTRPRDYGTLGDGVLAHDRWLRGGRWKMGDGRLGTWSSTCGRSGLRFEPALDLKCDSARATARSDLNGRDAAAAGPRHSLWKTFQEDVSFECGI